MSCERSSMDSLNQLSLEVGRHYCSFPCVLPLVNEVEYSIQNDKLCGLGNNLPRQCWVIR